MSEETKPLNIYQRLNQVRKAISYVKKDKKVQNMYMAVTHDAVTASVREHLIEFGVMIVPSLESATISQSGMTTGKGIPFIRLETVYVINFVNIDDPADRVEQRILAHALDEGDKAPGKALSYATKYAMLKLLSLETGDDDENREHAKVARRVEEDNNAARGGARRRMDDDTAAEVDALAGRVFDAITDDNENLAFSNYKTGCLALSHNADAQAAFIDMFSAPQRTQFKKLRKAELEKEREAKIEMLRHPANQA